MILRAAHRLSAKIVREVSSEIRRDG